jgi:hypothetical protein
MKKILNYIIFTCAIVAISNLLPDSFTLSVGFVGGWIYCKLQQKGYVW